VRGTHADPRVGTKQLVVDAVGALSPEQRRALSQAHKDLDIVEFIAARGFVTEMPL